MTKLPGHVGSLESLKNAFLDDLKGKQVSKQESKTNKSFRVFKTLEFADYFSNLLNIKKGKHGADFFKISKVFSGFQVLTS